MKQFYLTIFSVCLLITTALCQETIEVSYDKGVMLVFPVAVKPDGWNCGDREMVGVAVNGNKILLQAKEPDFDETNLIVELEDGSIYAFTLVYNNGAKKFFYAYGEEQALYKSGGKPVTSQTDTKSNSSKGKSGNSQGKTTSGSTGGSSGVSLGKTEKDRSTEESISIDIVCKAIASSPDYIKRIGVLDKKMMLYVGGIYIIDNKLYFKVNIKNFSTIPYNINYGEFITKNITKGLKGGSAQAERKKILALYNPANGLVMNDKNDGIYSVSFGVIEGKGVLTLVYVFDKFTISEDKKLFIDLWEKNGERSLELPIESAEILNAKINYEN
jgi:hypothetical protein